MAELRKDAAAKGAAKNLGALVEKARSDPRLLSSMVADLDSVVREADIPVDPESAEYQELAVRLYHLRTIQTRMMDELSRKIGSFSHGLPGGGLFGYAGLVGGGAIDPVPYEKLKSDIIAELRNELKR